MARSVLPIAGALIGGMFGAPQLGFVLGSLIGNAIDPQVIKGPSIGDGQTQTSQEGVPRPIVWGTGVVGGNVIDHSEIYKSIKRTRQGKGGGPVTEEERMHMTYAIRICEGPIDAVTRIWEDEKLVYDTRHGGQVDAAENAKFADKFRLYLGTEDQMPDPELEVVHGAGNAPSYRGTAYIVFPRNDVTDRRGSIPNYRFEVARGEQEVQEGISFMTSHQYFNGEIGSFTLEGSAPLNAGGWFDFSSDAQLVVRGTLSGPRLYKRDPGAVSYTELPVTGAGSGYELPVCFSRNDRWVLARRTGWLDCFEVSGTGMSLHSSIAIDEDSDNGQKRFWLSPSGSRIVGQLFRTSSHPKYSLSFVFRCMFDQETGTLSGYVDSNYNPPLSATGRSHAFWAFSPDESMLAGATSGSTSWAQEVYDFSSLDMQRVVRSGDNPIGGTVGLASFITWTSNTSFFGFAANGYSGKYEFSDEPGYLDGTLIATELPGGETGSSTIDGIGVQTKDGEYFAISGGKPASDFKYHIYIYKKTGSTITLVQDLDLQSGAAVGVQPDEPVGMAFSNLYQSSSPLRFGYLGDIVKDICTRMGVPLEKVDTTEIDDIVVDGVVAAKQYTGANILRSLQDSYFFDPGEWDGVIHFVKRGKDVVGVLTIDDLYDDPYSAERKSAIEYPRKIELIYQSPIIGYDVAKAVSERNSPSFNVSGSSTIEVPVVLTEDHAAQIADKQHKVAWAEAAGDINLSTSSEWDTLTPTDCIGVVLRDTVRRVRIEKIERAAGVLKLTTKEDRQSAYTSNVTGIPLPTPPPPPPTIAGEVTFAYMNAPALADTHDILGYYVAGGGETQAYYGAVVDRSIADDDFAQVAELPLGTTIGYLVEDLAAASEHYPDTTNKLVVQLLPNGLLEDVTHEQLLRENNAAAIVRADGTVEVVQFRDTSLIGEDLYELSYLIRGRLNSGATAHGAGDLFVFLDGSVRLVSIPSSAIGLKVEHRATAYGESPEDSDVVEHTYAPALSQTEFPVDLLTAELTSATDVVVAWSPRERFGTDINPVRSINWSGYRITYDDGTSSLSFDTLLPEHAADLTGFTGTVTITVYQLNRITGAGPGVSTTIAL